MITKRYEDYLAQLCRKLYAKNHKILPLIDEYAARPKNTIFLTNIKTVFFTPNCTSQLQPLDL
jgi:hypothetical protein